MLQLFISIMTCLVVPMSMLGYWKLSNGNLKAAYVLFMIATVMYMVIETTMALTVPAQLSILLFNIPNLWAFFMSYKGLQRLQHPRKENVK